MIGGVDSGESGQQQSSVQQQYGSVNQHNLTTYKVIHEDKCSQNNEACKW